MTGPTATSPGETVDGVLAVLAGAPFDQVAANLGMTPTDLAEALETYLQAGRVALQTQAATRDWYQLHIEFSEWAAAEQIAVAHLGPELQRFQDSGVIAAWWFIRKAPYWRVRIKPTCEIEHASVAIESIMDKLTACGLLGGWRRTVYEPESAAFGSQGGMDIAHDLFCADSSNILAYLRQRKPTLGRRELSVLVCSALFRGAGQEWFECGDVWHRVTRLRPTPSDVPADRLAELAGGLRTLLAHDARPAGSLFGTDGLLSFAAPWAAGFYRAGRKLRAAADDGKLDRGTRDILAYHVIFHWNRLGLPTVTQTNLANAAKIAILGRGGDDG